MLFENTLLHSDEGGRVRASKYIAYLWVRQMLDLRGLMRCPLQLDLAMSSLPFVRLPGMITLILLSPNPHLEGHISRRKTKGSLLWASSLR